MKNGFSLVELSIVLVILGLLVGGILAGQSLIRAAELRSVSSEYQRYVTAVHSFRDKYFQLPGDMNNATSFWGKDNVNCTAHAGTTATPGTCNGNGSGTLSPASAGGATGEIFQFWKQLALAGLIEGTYSGLAGAAGTYNHVIGTNTPASKLSSSGWSCTWVGNLTGQISYFDGSYGNPLQFGSNSPTADDWVNDPTLRAQEAWNIDTKMDDGLPQSGSVRALKNASRPSCVVAANNAYDLANTTALGCNLMFIAGF